MPHLSLTGARWTDRVVDPLRVSTLQASTGLSPIAARVLASRWDGEGTPDRWLEPEVGHLHDPLRMFGMEAALDRLQHAVRRGEKIRIITDYDVDGTTSSLILQAALRMVDPHVQLDYHIPNRFAEGYGFSVTAARKAAEDGVGLIVTADIGVRDHAAVEAARAAGVDVLICDHHLPAGADVPEGATVLCPPQAACAYPNAGLAACGVSLKLATGLLQGHGKWDAILRSLLKLAAIGTVADMVPLSTTENRAIVTLGLRSLNEGPHHAGLAALLEVAGTDVIRATDLGYKIGPRINAAGRLADATLVVELLNCRNPERASTLAKRLDQLNRDRRSVQKRLEAEALAQLEGTEPAAFVVVAGQESDGWHRGVVGIVASRLKDKLNRPCAVVSIQGDRAVGSVRSVPSVHAVRALDAGKDLLLKYGGHPAAAGFTVPTEHLDTLRTRLAEFVAEHAGSEELRPVRESDTHLDPAELDGRLFYELSRLGPFGQGNPQPQLVVRGVRARRVSAIGRDSVGLRFTIPTPDAPMDAIWWQHADKAETLADSEVDLFGHLEENTWKNRTSIRFVVDDARLSAGQSASAQSSASPSSGSTTTTPDSRSRSSVNTM
ncbi:MAG: single-stranded-DNA-specific exonuclease [Myxococcota bacterium]|jgi:single-stranded-DNA-specific exonuclease